jgi:hypothetical protein
MAMGSAGSAGSAGSQGSESTFAVRPAPLGYTYARQWIRLFALTIDGVIVVVPLILLLALAVVVHGGGLDYADLLLNPAKSGWVTGIMVYAISSVATLLWFAVWQATVGASPGMMLLRLQVRGPDGIHRPSLPAALIRNALPILSNFNSITGNEDVNRGLGLIGLVVYLAIGISISNSPTRQGFHDRLAGGTFVLRRGKRLPTPQLSQ